ncbi:hypothetical protein H6P81_003294 [Aristolochia fimbriata]|uniref:FAD/NAD(P)-binding domain-containing protein n=1 Tax=Aristolochia fimbriata TaxID=158543 RepID=A0AAV7FFD9_ARIFI|nr:hypothetical protein H6P81_003294 [Aristolochia fimbriata]
MIRWVNPCVLKKDMLVEKIAVERKKSKKGDEEEMIISEMLRPPSFGIHGVKEHAIFLREVSHAQEIRRKLLLNLMLSDLPGFSDEEKTRLLHCVVVGGGPIGVEFSGELSDFIMRDVRQRLYPFHYREFWFFVRQANEILSSFDVRLRHYATNQLTKVTAANEDEFLGCLFLPCKTHSVLAIVVGFLKVLANLYFQLWPRWQKDEENF